MTRNYDRWTGLVTVSATPQELYDNLKWRDLLPDSVRSECDERTRLNRMTPEQRMQYEKEKYSFFDDDERRLLG